MNCLHKFVCRRLGEMGVVLSACIVPGVFALIVWWFSTGAILWLDRRAQRTFRWSMLAATAIAAIAFYGLAIATTNASPGAAYLAFTCAVLIWGWQEMAFLMGFVTGPRRTACKPGCGGPIHFRHGVEAVIYHELALVACGLAIAGLSWGCANQVGLWTFALLWALKMSAKLNLFLGVPNSGAELLPPHLRYLETFFARRHMNLLFPVSITCATSLAAVIWAYALAAGSGTFEATAFALLATLVSLAVLEHWLMVLPFRSTALWAWYLRRRPGEHQQRVSCGEKQEAAQVDFMGPEARRRELMTG